MPNHGKGPPRKPDELKRLLGTYRKDRASPAAVSGWYAQASPLGLGGSVQFLRPRTPSQGNRRSWSWRCRIFPELFLGLARRGSWRPHWIREPPAADSAGSAVRVPGHGCGWPWPVPFDPHEDPHMKSVIPRMGDPIFQPEIGT